MNKFKWSLKPNICCHCGKKIENLWRAKDVHFFTFCPHCGEEIRIIVEETYYTSSVADWQKQMIKPEKMKEILE